MGVHGLTTFVSSYRDKYKEKIHIRESPVVIDGSNLMYYLYFDGKHAVVERGGGKKGNNNGTALPAAYLFGGDWEQYAQNVRYFFQQLKQCEILPIVILDGAYDDVKLEVAKTRFAKTVKENIKPEKPNGGSPVPGKSYTPIFLKTVLLEVLAEQKVAHYQAMEEADHTIAYVARLLGDCPILSSDSDFLIYVNAKAIPLTSLKFGKVKPSRRDRAAKAMDREELPEKVWTLQAEFVSLPKLCRDEFKMRDPRLLGLAAIILGNDKVPRDTFRNFHCAGGRGDLKQRIARVMQWLTGQRSVEAALKNILSNISTEKRKNNLEANIRASLSDYDGEGGETIVWDYLSEDVDLTRWIDKRLFSRIELSREEKIAALKEYGDMDLEKVANLNLSDSGVKVDLENNDISIVVTLPLWYIDAHVKTKLQSYLTNLLKNHIVFFTPQIEIYKEPSCHDLSIPIIQVTAGILIGDPDICIELLSHQNGRVSKKHVNPVVSIPEYGPLPLLISKADDSSPSKVLNPLSGHEERVSVMLAGLGFFGNKTICKFVDGWPSSYRIWILTLIYFTKHEIHYINTSECDFSFHDCISIVTAIFLNVIKNLVVNPGNALKNNSGNCCITDLNSLYESTGNDQNKLQHIRRFYQTYETLSVPTRKNFMRDYDIRLTHSLSKYVCVLFHSEMLNNLLGNPIKSPKVRYTMNNFFIYRIAEKLSSCKKRLDANSNLNSYKEFVSEVIDVEEIQSVLVSFLQTLVESF